MWGYSITTYVDKMRGRGGQKMAEFCPHSYWMPPIIWESFYHVLHFVFLFFCDYSLLHNTNMPLVNFLLYNSRNDILGCHLISLSAFCCMCREVTFYFLLTTLSWSVTFPFYRWDFFEWQFQFYWAVEICWELRISEIAK